MYDDSVLLETHIKALDIFLIRSFKERELLNKQLPNTTKLELANTNSSKLFGSQMFKNLYKNTIGLVTGKKEYAYLLLDCYTNHISSVMVNGHTLNGC